MFRGRYEHAIDKKGRTSLPARFREVLSAAGESRLVITSGLEPCLVAYSMSEWLAFEERLSALPQFDPSVAMLRRIYVSGAVECELDKMGRVLIPATLRKHAELEREATWAGMGKHIELWATARFDAMRESVLDDAEKRQQMAARLAELGL
ncbi:MAG TPA: division/cell wall cluster transcriptional repressor MraZ [Polyangiaceae bacterium LLY-WYZ-15_(1-7)]|nr:division/cell wall cluster transcriptional repressor MraZ [Sandaracinus sp.]HJK89664.1 division/cell wall cluster transcriptional repressor MraZ [Polyangiaceae bacterium LLY-WYZ-15_(1-7)]HJL01114.1 division/cell wall cluster transcriptional repressor MraZ [Polyangiaceae bacterium LLY-WYZ-15_(1-7)]HJL09965.1 division/cell wall cluster transcriptional repressor MraZ [Polyangiaceae bacterium LLY-WYZ-15_(1-7)]HJL25441.1 division/cell wall cluster transcriptional repressor MraZ [Polyangiaceae bac